MFHALAEVNGFEILLCKANHVKNVPFRKTDATDAVWLAQLHEVGLLRGSFITSAEIAAVPGIYPIPPEVNRGAYSQETLRLHKVF